MNVECERKKGVEEHAKDFGSLNKWQLILCLCTYVYISYFLNLASVSTPLKICFAQWIRYSPPY